MRVKAFFAAKGIQINGRRVVGGRIMQDCGEFMHNGNLHYLNGRSTPSLSSVQIGDRRVVFEGDLSFTLLRRRLQCPAVDRGVIVGYSSTKPEKFCIAVDGMTRPSGERIIGPHVPTEELLYRGVPIRIDDVLPRELMLIQIGVWALIYNRSLRVFIDRAWRASPRMLPGDTIYCGTQNVYWMTNTSRGAFCLFDPWDGLDASDCIL